MILKKYNKADDIVMLIKSCIHNPNELYEITQYVNNLSGYINAITGLIELIESIIEQTKENKPDFYRLEKIILIIS